MRVFLPFLAASLLLGQIAFGTQGEPTSSCGEETYERSIAAVLESFSHPTSKLGEKFFKDGRWEIPTTEIPYTVENLIQSRLRIRPYHTHTSTEKRDCWVGSQTRGVLNLETGVRNLDTKSHRKTIRKLLNDHGLQVKVDYRFDDVVKGCATTPHGSPIWVKDPTTGAMVPDGFIKLNQPGDPDHGRTIYTTSTWISPGVQKLWKEAFAAGIAHSIGVYNHQGVLVAGSVLFVVDGNMLSVAAFTASEITRRIDEKQVFTRPLLSDSGHVEFLATLLLAAKQGFEYLDVSMLIPGIGAGKIGGVTISAAEFVTLLDRAKAKAAFIPGSGPEGWDITYLVTGFSAPKEN